MASPLEQVPVSGKEYRALRKLPGYKQLSKQYENEGASRDAARAKARAIVLKSPGARAYMQSRGFYYPSEFTGVADPGYIVELTNEFVEKFSDAPDFARTEEVIRLNIAERMKSDGVEFAGHDDAETILDTMVGHVIARRRLEF